MMARWPLLLFAILALGLSSAQESPQIKEGIPLIVPGSALGWENAELKLVLRVENPSEVDLQLYSPGFDPNDYRSPHELGDERYDGGKGDLLAVYELRKGDWVIVRKNFGIEPHAWHRLYKGRLEPGEYTVSARFYGNGKNAVIFSLKVLSGSARLQLSPGSMQTYNVVRGGWQTPFVIGIPEPSKGARVGVYDGDGPTELDFRVRTPEGLLRPPVPGNREWTYVPTEEPGRYAFSFRIPKTALQHTNTIGIQLFPGEIRVEIVDTEGRPVSGASYRIQGGYRRVVELLAPSGWKLVRTEINGGREKAPGFVVFGLGRGSVRFVLKEARPPGILRLETKVRCGAYEVPYPTKVKIGEKTYQVPSSGILEIELPEGTYPISTKIPGALVEGDARARVISGRKARAQLVIRPIVKIELDLPKRKLQQEERFSITSRASTEFPSAIPVQLSIALPEELLAEGPSSYRGPLSREHPVSLTVPVVAKKPGNFRVRARVEPCGASTSGLLEVRSGPKLLLRKEADREAASVGSQLVFRITVENHGDQPADLRLLDEAPQGFDGPSLDEHFVLRPGEVWKREVRGRVGADAESELVNTARLFLSDQEVARAEARVRVLRGELGFSCRVAPNPLLPGEKGELRVQVENRGSIPVRYALKILAPGWISVLSEGDVTGELAPGAETVKRIPLSVAFGPEVKGRIKVAMQAGGFEKIADCEVARALLQLEKTVQPARVLPGDEATYTIRVKNPLDRGVHVRLVDLPAEGLGLERREWGLELPPGGERIERYSSKPTQPGRFRNQAAVYVGDVPAAHPVRAELEVVPPLSPTRVSTVRLPFQVEARGDALLIRHAVPQGAKYRLGSSRLDGRPMDDPRVDGEGRLYWRIPFQEKGVLQYELTHEKPLPRMAEPELTLLVGDRSVPLKGSVRPEDFEKAKPLKNEVRKGLIKSPLPGTVFRDRDAITVRIEAPYGARVRLLVNGKEVPQKQLGKAEYDKGRNLATLTYYAVKLQPGRNLIEVQAGNAYDRIEVFLADKPVALKLVPVRVIADGRTPLRFRIEARDRLGLTQGRGFVTVSATPEPTEPDAAPQISGYQVALKDGVAELVLKPMASPGWARIQAFIDDLQLDERVYVSGTKKSLALGQGSITVRYAEGTFELGGLARGYFEGPFAGGYLQGALEYQMGSGSVYPGLKKQEDPTERFPVTGAGEEARLPLRSDDGIAFRYDRGAFTVGYGRFGDLPGLLGSGRTSVLMAECRGNVRVRVFVGLYPSERVEERILPDGTRVYRVSRSVKPGSEEVYLERGGERIRLVHLRDYTMDYSTGTLYLSRPLWPSSSDFVPQTLVVSYAPENAPRDRVAAGALVGYQKGGFTIELAAASMSFPNDLRLGARAAYRERGFGLRFELGYEDGVPRAALTAEGRRGGISTRVNFHYRERLSGRARISARVGEAGQAVFEHQALAGRNQTSLVYEHRLGSNLFAGLGGGYIWESRALALLGRAGYRGERLQLSVTHAQPFSGSPETNLRADYQVDANLSLGSELAYRWGEGLHGRLGLDQKLGSANLSLNYQLPGASGEGNRARFGIRVPWPVSDRWTLDLTAGYERSFSTGASLVGAGVGIRYQTEDFKATLGFEGATGSSGDKLTLRAGAAGQLDRRQVLEADANFQLVPRLDGRFTLAYAYRGRSLQLLTYHRLTLKEGTEELTGELAPSWHPSLAFQLRPSLAYRVDFADPGANLYQVGLGFNYYPLRWLGFGAGGYYLYQPAYDASHLAFSVEGSVRMLDPLWMNLGYTFGGFTGLTPEAKPGMYLRLDFFGVLEGVDW